MFTPSLGKRLGVTPKMAKSRHYTQILARLGQNLHKRCLHACMFLQFPSLHITKPAAAASPNLLGLL